MYHRIVFSVILLFGLTVNAQTTINVRGKVSNLTGQAISNALVTLVRQNLKDTTGSDGTYSITRNTAVLLPAITPGADKISLCNGILELTLSSASPVKVEIFDLQGTLLKKEVLRNLAAGVYRWNIAKNALASNLLVIKASLGERVMSFRYVPLNSGTYTVNPSGEYATPIGGGLAQMAAVVDTLRTTASGYLTKMVTITSYDVEQNITLDSAGNAVTVRLDQTRQVIDGFGINNTWGGGWSDAIANELFDSTSGLGLTILRIGMGPDGNPYNGNSCWDDIKKAKARGAKYIIGTCWTPPANYKTNNNVNGGGHLKSENYNAWATTIAAFASKVKSGSGYDLYGMSPQNETDFASCGSVEPCNGDYNTCIYTGKEYADFLKVVGPKIKAAGCKVIAPEASEWLHVWSNVSGCCSVPSGKPSSDPLKCGCFVGKNTDCSATCTSGGGYDYGHWMYKDSESWAQVDILGTHQYDTQVAEPWPSDVPKGNIRVWQTEMSGVKWWPEGEPSSDIANGIAVAGWIHNALTVGEANAWCWWWYKALGATNEGLHSSSGADTKRHYTFGNFTKYARPGMTRVDITGEIPTNVLLTAYKGTGNKVVIVAINKGSSSASVPITISGGTAPASMTPIVTSSNENWASKTALTVSNGTFTATLGSKTVTTFVSK
jgi:glucuronoarabinoxylan endo-1,4-beta-xylanase